MKRLLLAAALAIAFASPAVAAPKHHHRAAPPIYCTAINGITTAIIDGKPYSMPSSLVRFVTRKCIYVQSFEAEQRTITGHEMSPAETYQFASSHPGGLGNLQFDDLTGGLLTTPTASAPPLTLPYSMSAGDGTQAPTAASGVGILAYNGFTGTVDRVQVDSSERLITATTLSGTNTVNLQVSTRTTVSGNNPSGAFGTTTCTVPPCTKQVVTGAGTLTTVVWNSLTDMSGFTITCWDGTSAGTIDNQVFQAQLMSSGATLPIPAGGWRFTVGLFCQTSAAISVVQAFNFWTHT